MLALLALLQTLPPPPSGVHYYARTDFQGPGQVCAATYTVTLAKNETAVSKSLFGLVEEVRFRTREGQFTVRETQSVGDDGEVIRKVADGTLSCAKSARGYVWSYRDKQPGSTDVYGPAVNAPTPAPALDRITFGALGVGTPRYKMCMRGTNSKPKVTP